MELAILVFFPLHASLAVNVNLRVAFITLKACTFTASKPVKVSRDSVDELANERSVRMSGTKGGGLTAIDAWVSNGHCVSSSVCGSTGLYPIHIP
jgi:hypothetical protein